jgi:two-component system chemotaxis response regulator CheY
MPRSDREAAPRVLSVGQCGFDHRTIAGYLGRQFGALVECANTFDEARDALYRARFDLVLINRVLDLDETSGLDLIRTLKAECGLEKVPVMLVSNYPDAQQAAIDLGASPGFGKADLGSPATHDRLKSLLG